MTWKFWVGEAIDKCSKVMGLGYPGGPIIDKLARQGNPKAFTFSKPHIPDYNYSFSGLKTSFLYSLRDWLKEDPNFIEHHKNPKFSYTTDNAAMIAITGYYKYLDKDFCTIDKPAYSRVTI